MRDIDFGFFFAFIKRAGMYTGSNEDYGYKGVGPFLYAYETGANGECNFKSHLIEKISDKYGVPPHNGGLENQLKEAANKSGIAWHKLFQNAANETLVDLSDRNGKNRFVKLLRDSLIIELKKLKDNPTTYLRINWNHQLDQINDWQGVNISELEKKKLFELLDNLSYLSTDPEISNPELHEKCQNQITELIKLLE